MRTAEEGTEEAACADNLPLSEDVWGRLCGFCFCSNEEKCSKLLGLITKRIFEGGRTMMSFAATPTLLAVKHRSFVDQVSIGNGGITNGIDRQKTSEYR